MLTKVKPIPSQTCLSVSAGEQRFELRRSNRSSVHLLLAQINPTAVVLAAIAEDEAAQRPSDRSTTFNLSIVAEDGISLTQIAAGPTRRSLLTPRQIDILALSCEGYSRQEISASLDISIKVVRDHLSKIRRRLQARTTTHAAHIATDLRLISRRNGNHSHYLEHARVTTMLTSAPTLRVTLTSLEQRIELGGDEGQIIAVGTRGRVHVSQIRQPPTGHNRSLDLCLIRGNTTRQPGHGANADNSGIPETTIRRRLKALCSTPNGDVAVETVAAQMGLVSPQDDVHAAAREWLAREFYADRAVDEKSPIFTTFDS